MPPARVIAAVRRCDRCIATCKYFEHLFYRCGRVRKLLRSSIDRRLTAEHVAEVWLSHVEFARVAKQLKRRKLCARVPSRHHLKRHENNCLVNGNARSTELHVESNVSALAAPDERQDRVLVEVVQFRHHVAPNVGDERSGFRDDPHCGGRVAQKMTRYSTSERSRSERSSADRCDSMAMHTHSRCSQLLCSESADPYENSFLCLLKRTVRFESKYYEIL